MLLSKLTGKKTKGAPLEISGLTLDSRKVKPGFLFAGVPGEKTNGTKFIDEAVKKGAVAVLTNIGDEIEVKGAVHISDPNPRAAFAKMVASFYGAQPKTMAAITGTNGKTSTAHFVRQLWAFMGAKAGSIGTLGVVSEGLNYSLGLTTPEPVDLHFSLKEMVDHKVTHAVVETSSHGLSQFRIDGIKFDIAGFTNLTQDHMDYHADEENYFAAKRRLFDELLSDKGTGVINSDNPFGKRLKASLEERGVKTLTVGRRDADLTLHESTPGKGGQKLVFSYKGKKHQIQFPVVGTFQGDNVMLAAGMVIASGFDADKVFDRLYYLAGVPGRMEKVADTPYGGEVYIDYAHTPDGLTNALTSIRQNTFGKLHLIFGCGGNRDQGKRPKMGVIAETQADFVYVTDDNPRHENPMDIRQEILAACPTGQEFVDRGDAIRFGVRALKQDDVLIITGKGNETGQIIGDKVLPFSDKDVVRETISAMVEEVA